MAQSFDVANELATQQLGGTTVNTFGYDLNGNRTSATDSQHATTTYTYDQANQLIDYEGRDRSGVGGNASDQFVYNGDGLRQTKTQNNSLTNEVWDTSGGLPLLIEDGPTAYITGPGGLPIEQITQDGNGNGVARYYSHDQLGTTTALTDQTGNVVAQYAYDAYGQPTGTAPAIAQPFGYAGQYTDSETGLQYLRARYYDPATGQMMTRDPAVGSTREPYAYASDSPANASDPTGLQSFWSSLSDYLYGAGVREVALFDGLTGGLTADARHLLGIDDSAVVCSLEYQSRHDAGTVMSFMLPVGGEFRAAEGLRNVAAGLIREGDLLRAAERWLGEGYSEIAPGVYRSADNARQFRMTPSDLGATRPHVHFESIGPNGREITENAHVYLK